MDKNVVITLEPDGEWALSYPIHRDEKPVNLVLAELMLKLTEQENADLLSELYRRYSDDY